MARTLDEIVRDTVGNLTLQICQLTAENEALKEALAATKPPEKDTNG